MPSIWETLNRQVYQDRPDAPAGGGFSGFLRRFGTGFVQGATPNTPGQMAGRVLNPIGSTVGAGVTEGLRDAVRGADWYQRVFGGSPYGNNQSMYPDRLEDWQRAPAPESAPAAPAAGRPTPQEPAPVPRATQAFRPSQFQRNQAARQAPRERTEEEAAADRRAALDNSSAYGTARFLETMRFAPRGHVE